MSPTWSGVSAGDLARMQADIKARARKIHPMGKDTADPPRAGGRPKSTIPLAERERVYRQRQNARRQARRETTLSARPAIQSPSGEQINVTLPYPPSVNHYWLLNRNGSRRISERGNVFRAAVQARCPGIRQIAGPVAVSVRAHPPDKRRRDLDNILKSLLDALQHALLIEDDSNVAELHIVRQEIIPGGAVMVEIRAL